MFNRGEYMVFGKMKNKVDRNPNSADRARQWRNGIDIREFLPPSQEIAGTTVVPFFPLDRIAHLDNV